MSLFLNDDVLTGDYDPIAVTSPIAELAVCTTTGPGLYTIEVYADVKREQLILAMENADYMSWQITIDNYNLGANQLVFRTAPGLDEMTGLPTGLAVPHTVDSNFTLFCPETNRSMSEAEIPEGYDVSFCPFCHELIST